MNRRLCECLPLTVKALKPSVPTDAKSTARLPEETETLL